METTEAIIGMDPTTVGDEVTGMEASDGMDMPLESE
jgi:hypothetical protein